MLRSKIAGIGKYVPDNIVTNDTLTKYMETSDEWIQERTGIRERRYAGRDTETTTTLGVEASKIAIERAGIAGCIKTSWLSVVKSIHLDLISRPGAEISR